MISNNSPRRKCAQELGLALKIARIASRRTIADVAASVGMSAKHYRYYEYGSQEMGATRLTEIMDVLRINSTHLSAIKNLIWVVNGGSS